MAVRRLFCNKLCYRFEAKSNYTNISLKKMGDEYRGTCKRGEPYCYVFIRYNVSRYQDTVNSLVKRLSISKEYTASILGFSKHVECLEGQSDWARNKGIAVIKFVCECEAERWLQCTPDIRQQDWIDGDIDIVSVSLRDRPHFDKMWFQLIDITHINNYASFCDNYVDKLNPYLSRLDGSAACGVAAVSKPHGGNGPKTLRGRWRPNTLIVNQFDCEEAFRKVYCAEEYQELKAARQELCNADVVLFQLIPLMHKKC